MTEAAREFWVSSGHHLARRTEGGGLAVTDELLLAYLAAHRRQRVRLALLHRPAGRPETTGPLPPQPARGQLPADRLHVEHPHLTAAPRKDGPGLHLLARRVVVPLYPKKPPIAVEAPAPAHMRAAIAGCEAAG